MAAQIPTLRGDETSQAKHRRLTPVDVAEDMRQTESAHKRSNAIKVFCKYLRRQDRFHATWAAAGDAEGVAELMSRFSVRDVRAMCAGLGRTTGAINARPERRRALGELVDILYGQASDRRPLRALYQDIIPACDPELAQQWDKAASKPVEWTTRQKRRLLQVHRQDHEQRFLNSVFDPDSNDKPDFSGNQHLYLGNKALEEALLVKLASLSPDKVRIPQDFAASFAEPLLQKLCRRRTGARGAYVKFLGLVTQCFTQHARHLKDRLHLNDNGVIQNTMQQWVGSRVFRESIESHLVVLIANMPEEKRSLSQLDDALRVPRRLNWEDRYILLRLLLKHLPGYRVDIDDPSEATAARFKSWTTSGNLWPTDLFLRIETTKSQALFARLEVLHPGESFLRCNQYGNTIFKQESSPQNPSADIEIMRAHLLYQLADPTPEDWLVGTRVVVQERMAKATESREPRERLFWVRSAIHLCVAAGDLEKLHEVLVWSRRFTRDPLVGPEIFSDSTLRTRKMEALLVGFFPYAKDPRFHHARAAAARLESVHLANQVLVALIQTALASVGQPGFKKNKWKNAFALPEMVMQRRLRGVSEFRRLASTVVSSQSDPHLQPDAMLVQLVWKPTLEAFAELESLTEEPRAKDVADRNYYFSCGSLASGLPAMKPTLLVDVVRHYMDIIEQRFVPAMRDRQMHNIVSAVSKIAQSDQPALAIPFVKHIIRNSKESSWHRMLLHKGFLESLPSDVARAFLLETVTTVAQLMAAQNEKEWTVIPTDEATEGQRQPMVKVTVIKMMAQVLEGNLLVDPATSCNALVSLLVEARHIDARVAIVSSLLTTLAEPTSAPELRKQILDIIETHVVPMASQLDERRPTTEADWQAETMPTVSSESSILALLLKRATSNKLQEEDRKRIAVLVMRSLEVSAAANKRWMGLLLQRNGIDPSDAELLPVGPANLDLLTEVFQDPQHRELIPRPLFVMLRDVCLVNADPTDVILRITELVRADRKLLESPAGRHWLRQYANSGESSLRLGVGMIASDLRDRVTHAYGQSEITGQDRVHFVTSVGEAYMRRGEVAAFEELVTQLCPSVWLRSSGGLGVTVAEKLIQRLEGLRSQKLDVVLPEPFGIRLKMLPMPGWDRGSPEAVQQEEVDDYAGEVSRLVCMIAEQRLYHANLSQFVGASSRNWRSSPTYARFSVALATTEDVWAMEQLPLATQLRLEVAAVCLQSCPAPLGAHKQKVWDLLEDWKVCANDELRNLGLKLHAALSKQDAWQLP